MKHKKPYDKSVYRSLVLISQFSINMLVPICMLTVLGVFLDRRLGTSYITIILFFVGAVAGAQGVYRLAKNTYNEEEQQDKAADTQTNQQQTVSKPKKTSGWKQE